MARVPAGIASLRRRLLRRAHDLTTWDLIVVNSSAGKDSQAMLDVIATAAAEQGVLDRVVVVHADLGRVEWQGTKALVYTQAAAYDLDSRTFDIARPQGDLVAQITDRAAKLRAEGSDAPAWPSSTARYCTSDQKRGQCRKVLTALVDAIRRAGVALDSTGPVRVLNCLGFRAEESPARANRAPMTRNGPASNGKREVYDYLPIHDMTLSQVWARCDAAGTPRHPAYALGMPRLSCIFCVFAPKAALVIAARHNPTLFAEYLALEPIAGTFRNGFSLAEVAEAVAAGTDAAVTAEAAADWNM